MCFMCGNGFGIGSQLLQEILYLRTPEPQTCTIDRLAKPWEFLSVLVELGYDLGSLTVVQVADV